MKSLFSAAVAAWVLSSVCGAEMIGVEPFDNADGAAARKNAGILGSYQQTAPDGRCVTPPLALARGTRVAGGVPVSALLTPVPSRADARTPALIFFRNLSFLAHCGK
jgi:hypothetical protein